MKLADYNNEFGDIDLFLLDLLLKGEVMEQADVLDAGCGAGRNTLFFLKHGFHISAIDSLRSEVNATNLMSRSLNKGDVAVHGDLAELPYNDHSFDLIVCSRVLHFAESHKKFSGMLSELFRVLRRNGILYLSMNSAIGLEKPDTSSPSNRFLMTGELLDMIATKWRNIQEPRTVIFSSNHSETTLVLQKI